MAAAKKANGKPGSAAPAAPKLTPQQQARAYARLAIEVFAIWAVIHTLLIAGYRIPSGSMEPTLLVGDFLFVSPLPLGPHVPFTSWNLPGFSDPKRGTINIYESPPQHWDPANPIFMKEDSTPTIVKRIVAVPGDTIHMRGGVFYVNGVEQRPPVVALPVNPSQPGETNPAFAWQRAYELKDSRFGPPPAVITHDDWGPLLVPPKSYFSLGDNRYSSIDARYYGWIPRKNFRGRPLFIYISFDVEDLRIRWERFFKILWNA